ncbi:hypothetical protein [Paenibacillus sp. Z3-2]
MGCFELSAEWKGAREPPAPGRALRPHGAAVRRPACRIAHVPQEEGAVATSARHEAAGLAAGPFLSNDAINLTVSGSLSVGGLMASTSNFFPDGRCDCAMYNIPAQQTAAFGVYRKRLFV